MAPGLELEISGRGAERGNYFEGLGGGCRVGGLPVIPRFLNVRVFMSLYI